MLNSIVLLAYASLAVYLKFTLDSQHYSVDTNKKSEFYERWEQRKQLKNMEMSEVWPDTYDEGYIHQFQPEPTHKIQ